MGSPLGETFYEPAGARHTISSSGSLDQDARILAIIISERKQ